MKRRCQQIFWWQVGGQRKRSDLQIILPECRLHQIKLVGKWLHTCHLMKKKTVDLFGLAEIGINPKFPQVTEEISQIARCNWLHAVTNLTNTKQEQQGLSQRGGTSIITTNHWVSRIVEQVHDTKLGRWTYHILRGSHNHRVVFVSAYCVGQHTVSGPTTAATQQWASLMKDGQKNPNPRRQFMVDLTRQLHTWMDKG